MWIAGERVDEAFAAIASFTDLKSPWLRGHSTGVAELAEAAAWRVGLSRAAVTRIRRAALAHDLGRVGVSNAIWEKPGPLGFGEWERVRLHPHFTERAFALSPALAPIGVLGGAHHERLDGSGYHRGTRAPALAPEAHACSRRPTATRRCARPRPYRAASTTAPPRQSSSARPARRSSTARAVDAVLGGGGTSRAAPAARAAGRADRARARGLARARAGRSNAEIGEALGISAKTVGHHVQHVYAKAGVRSRAAATLWAVPARPGSAAA